MSLLPVIPLPQARRFLLKKQGLLGTHAYRGAEGALRYIHQAGSIQFDPLNVCGRNADLTLQSRVKGYAPSLLWGLLYTKRELVDYFDKELCIFPVSQWPHYARIRAVRGEWMRSHPQVTGARDAILKAIQQRGPLCSKDLDTGDKVNWFWGNTRLSRAVLEHLYYAGTLGIHHKQGAIKYYDLIERLLPPALAGAPDPHPTLESLHLHMLARRIGAVGLLWNKNSPALLGIPGFTAAARHQAMARLVADMWDRALISALFGFDYTWEVYVPAAKRKYGYYVLPLIMGERFIGRAEPVFDRKAGSMALKGLWHEPDVKVTAAIRKATDGCLARFEQFLRVNAQP